MKIDAEVAHDGTGVILTLPGEVELFYTWDEWRKYGGPEILPGEKRTGIVVFGVCEWRYDEDMDGEGHYQTSCGEGFFFTEGDRQDNRVKYCPYCMKPIREVQP